MTSAVADLTQAIKLSPDDAPRYNDRGIVYGLKGEPDRAIADFDAAVALDAQYAPAFNNRAIAYAAKGQPDTRHRRLRSGDQAQRRLCAGVLQSRQRALRQGRLCRAPCGL